MGEEHEEAAWVHSAAPKPLGPQDEERAVLAACLRAWGQESPSLALVCGCPWPHGSGSQKPHPRFQNPPRLLSLQQSERVERIVAETISEQSGHCRGRGLPTRGGRGGQPGGRGDAAGRGWGGSHRKHLL